MSKHMKRLTAPRSWRVERKTSHWIAKPSPGPHPIDEAVPLAVVLRDMLHHCDTYQEAKQIIGGRNILADGRIVTDPKFPLGLMDVLSIPKTREHFRVLKDRRGKLVLQRIGPEEARWKLVRIEDKKVVPGGRVQLNLHDGRNMLVERNEHKTGDVLKIELPGQKVLASFPEAVGSLAMLTGGHHVGELATIAGFEEKKNPMPNLVKFKEGFYTIRPYVFTIGVTVPEIKLPQVEVDK
ncbi:MAG: 30S ribosomal protein S4e [Euryarchaeota archaeon]|nr:30S ribosomal protein S4e [Euryarchaeota archaeon]